MKGTEEKKEPVLPNLDFNAVFPIDAVTFALGLPRNILPSGDEIRLAWETLPEKLKDIPPELLNELIAKMCVAVGSGLFDGALNYIWNASVLHLREKAIYQGKQISEILYLPDLEEKNLRRLPDFELLRLCLKLNAISRDSFYFLDKARAMRNAHSAAHPVIGTISDGEFLTFFHHCVQYALLPSSSPKGVDALEFAHALADKPLSPEQCNFWIGRLSEAHNSQQVLLVSQAHSVFCNTTHQEKTRNNAINICLGLKSKFNSEIHMELINRHHIYIKSRNDFAMRASAAFFEKLGLSGFLDDIESHIMFFKAVDRLWNVHNSHDGFFNEPPFAEQLLEISERRLAPVSIAEYYVHTVICCFIGNGHGYSEASEDIYIEIIKRFNKNEIEIMMKLAAADGTALKERLSDKSCMERFESVIRLAGNHAHSK